MSDTTIQDRMAEIAEEYDRMRAECDKAKAEMRAWVEALAPLVKLVEQVTRPVVEMKEVYLDPPYAPPPVAEKKEVKRRSPRAPRSRLTPENETQRVADWAIRHQQGQSLSAIAASDGVHFETVRVELERAGIPVRYQRRAKAPREQMPAMAGRCVECGMSFDSPSLKVEGIKAPLNGVCGGCQDVEEELARRREAGNGSH